MSQVFDEEGALDRVAGDRELLAELFQIAFDDAEERIASMKQAIAQNNPKQLADAAHSVKSAFGNIGAVACYDNASELEMLGKSNRLDSASQTFTTFLSNMEAFKNAIKNFQV